jgi:hypothetical protein
LGINGHYGRITQRWGSNHGHMDDGRSTGFLTGTFIDPGWGMGQGGGHFPDGITPVFYQYLPVSVEPGQVLCRCPGILIYIMVTSKTYMIQQESGHLTGQCPMRWRCSATTPNYLVPGENLLKMGE